MACALLVMFALQLFPPGLAWRVGFLIPVLLAFFALIIRKLVPESPRWLLNRHRFEDAEAIVDSIEKQVMEQKGLKELPAVKPIAIPPEVHSTRGQTKELFTKYPGRLRVVHSLTNIEK